MNKEERYQQECEDVKALQETIKTLTDEQQKQLLQDVLDMLIKKRTSKDMSADTFILGLRIGISVYIDRLSSSPLKRKGLTPKTSLDIL